MTRRGFAISMARTLLLLLVAAIAFAPAVSRACEVGPNGHGCYAVARDGRDGRDGVNGRDGSNGRDGRDGRDCCGDNKEHSAGGKSRDWIDYAGLSPALVSAAALVIALLNWRRTRPVMQAETFRQLRSAFSKIRDELPGNLIDLSLKDEPNKTARDKLKATVKNYWYASFDEWFITQKLNKDELGALWDLYYRDAIKGTCRSPLMVAGLLYVGEPHANSVAVDREFYEVVIKLVEQGVLAKAKTILGEWLNDENASP